jgi:hypothetical protein
MLVTTKSFLFFAGISILVVSGSTLTGVGAAFARDQKVAASEFRSRDRHYWARPPVITGPAVGVVTSGRFTTALANRNGYYSPFYGYYGGPTYYGGPYYYPPDYDGVSPGYFYTHPIVEW